MAVLRIHFMFFVRRVRNSLLHVVCARASFVQSFGRLAVLVEQSRQWDVRGARFGGLWNAYHRGNPCIVCQAFIVLTVVPLALASLCVCTAAANCKTALQCPSGSYSLLRLCARR